MIAEDLPNFDRDQVRVDFMPDREPCIMLSQVAPRELSPPGTLSTGSIVLDSVALFEPTTQPSDLKQICRGRLGPRHWLVAERQGDDGPFCMVLDLKLS